MAKKRLNSPLGKLIIHYIPSFLVITLLPSKEVYAFMFKVEGYPGQIIMIVTAAGILWYWYGRPNLRLPFKAWVPAVAVRIILSLALVAAQLLHQEEESENT
jgi:hypothetical protein